MLGQAVSASIYWQQGVRAKTVSVCFVGDALTSRPSRANQVLRYLRDFEYAANIKFPAAAESCSGRTTLPNGNDVYEGDIRIMLPFTSAPWFGPVPGSGCTAFRDAAGNYNGGNDNWGSWSSAPNDLSANRPCLYNLKLGDDGAGGVPYLNHALHEVGHALGLRHEMERADVDRALGCTEAGFGGNGTSYLTRYDQHSVMHYMFPSCNINGNYDYTGLSDLDQLSLHILYPEDIQVAEHVGTTVVPNSGRIVLDSAWGARGADLPVVAKDFKWHIDGIVVSSTARLDVQLPVGNYILVFKHGDFLGRTYSYIGQIRVLSAQAFAAQTAVVAAQVALY